MAKNSMKLEIFRFDPTDGKGPRFQTFEVPYVPGLTFLNALIYIQENLDGSLAFRSSCRAGVCGSCGMHIACQYRLACKTQVKDYLGSTITVRPLAHLPIYKDLVVDMTSFWAKYKYIKPNLIPGDEAPVGEENDSHLGDFVPDEDEETPVDVASNMALREQLDRLLGQLNEREREVLKLRFGLEDGYARTLEEVGHIFEVTRERIRQIEAKALKKLRQPRRNKLLREYLA